MTTTDGPDLGDVPELADPGAFEAALEALLLVVDAPVDEAALASALGQPEERIRPALARLSAGYTADGRGIDLRRAGEGWRFYTRDRYAPRARGARDPPDQGRPSTPGDPGGRRCPTRLGDRLHRLR